MKIFLENVNLNSSIGPNSFANKLVSPIIDSGHTFVSAEEADISLCFIESPVSKLSIPRIQRLDGIYYNTRFEYEIQNKNIKIQIVTLTIQIYYLTITDDVNIIR